MSACSPRSLHYATLVRAAIVATHSPGRRHADRWSSVLQSVRRASSQCVANKVLPVRDSSTCQHVVHQKPDPPKASSLRQPFSVQEIDDMISRCLYVLDLETKCYGSRFTPWPSACYTIMTKDEVRRRVESADFGLGNDELERLIREILLRDDALTAVNRAVQLMTAAFWDLTHTQKAKRRGYLPWTMTIAPFPYQIKKFGPPLPHYVDFYRIFMTVIGFTNGHSFDETGIPARIAVMAAFRNNRSLKRAVLKKQAIDCFTDDELAAMRDRATDLMVHPPEFLMPRKVDHSWPENLPLEERILSLPNHFRDDELHGLLTQLLLKPDALSSLQRSVRYVFEILWSHEQVNQCYLPSTCNGLIRNKNQNMAPLPHHKTFYSIFMHLFGYPNADSFNDSHEAGCVYKFALHVSQWERSARLANSLMQN